MPSLPRKAGGQDPRADAHPGTCAGLSAARAGRAAFILCQLQAERRPPPPDGCQGSGARPGHPLVYVPGVRAQLGWRRAGQPSQSQGWEAVFEKAVMKPTRPGTERSGLRWLAVLPAWNLSLQADGAFLQCPTRTPVHSRAQKGRTLSPRNEFRPLLKSTGQKPHTCPNTGRGAGVHRRNQQERVRTFLNQRPAL